METKICNRKGITIPANPQEIEELLRILNESPQNLISIITECTQNHEPAWHYNLDIFQSFQKITLTPVKKKHEVLHSEIECDFSDFMDEEEIRRLEKELAKTKPSEVMY
jgi:hypothetical protein